MEVGLGHQRTHFQVTVQESLSPGSWGASQTSGLFSHVSKSKSFTV